MKKPNITKGDWHREYNATYERKGKNYTRYTVKDSKNEVVAWHVDPLDAKAIRAVPDMIDVLVVMYESTYNKAFQYAEDELQLSENEAEAFALNDPEIKMITKTLKKAGCTE